MIYIFEWTNTEVFGYLSRSISGAIAASPRSITPIRPEFSITHTSSITATKSARWRRGAMDEGSCVNDAMVLEGVYGSQWPFTGKVLHRDYQMLACAGRSRRAHRARTRIANTPAKIPISIRRRTTRIISNWNGFDAAKDKQFKTERLRLLWVSARRSRRCASGSAHRFAQRLIAKSAAESGARTIRSRDRLRESQSADLSTQLR